MSNIEHQIPCAELPYYGDFLIDAQLTAQSELHQVMEYESDRRWSLARKYAVASLLVIGASRYVYDIDIAVADAQLANAGATIVQVYNAAPTAPNNTMVAVMAGLGNRNAFDTARSLPTYARMGDVAAINYDKKEIDPQTIAELIIQKAKAEGKKDVVLDGHSMGGIVATAAAAYIYNGNSGLKVKAVLLDCTPVNYDAVREGQRTTADTMLSAASFDKEITRSHIARFVVEMLARRSNYFSYATMDLDPAAMLTSAEQVVKDKFLSPDAASGMLISSQLDTIISADMADNLRSLSSTTGGKIPPKIFFEQPSDVFNDSVINDDYSRQQLEVITAKNGENFYTYYTSGGHADPIQAPSTYNAIAASIATVVNEIPKPPTDTLTLAYSPH